MMRAALLSLLVLMSLWQGSPASANPPPTYRAAATYCAAVGTVDDPLNDPRWVGPRYPAWIVKALDLDEQPDTAVWRCFDGVVLACAALSTILCMKALWITRNGAVDPDIDAMCRQEPNTPCLGGTHCLYQCRSGHADYSRYPTDARGFDRRDWRLVRPPSR